MKQLTKHLQAVLKGIRSEIYTMEQTADTIEGLLRLNGRTQSSKRGRTVWTSARRAKQSRVMRKRWAQKRKSA